jgi:hypothetical protein
MIGHPHVKDMLMVAKIRMENIRFLSHANGRFWIRGSGANGIIYYYLAANRETLFFAKREWHRPTVKGEGPQSIPTMDPAKLAKLQAQAASNRIGAFTSATSGRVVFAVLRLCVCLSC